MRSWDLFVTEVTDDVAEATPPDRIRFATGLGVCLWHEVMYLSINYLMSGGHDHPHGSLVDLVLIAPWPKSVHYFQLLSTECRLPVEYSTNRVNFRNVRFNVFSGWSFGQVNLVNGLVLDKMVFCYFRSSHRIEWSKVLGQLLKVVGTEFRTDFRLAITRFHPETFWR